MASKSALMTYLAVALILKGATARASEEVYSTAALALPEQQAGISARAFSLGSAMTGLADDSSALFYNPAGLGGQRDASVSLHHQSGMVDTVRETVVLGLPLDQRRGLAAALDYVNYGIFDGYDDNGVRQAGFTTDEIHVLAGFGQRLGAGVSLGGQAHTDQERVGDARVAGWGGALGALWDPGMAGLRLGSSLAGNSGSGLAGFQMSDFQMGASLNLLGLARLPLTLALAGDWPALGQEDLELGAELKVAGMAAVRGGWRASLYQAPASESMGMFSAGAGLDAGAWTLDYGLEFNDPLGFVQRLSLSYSFTSNPFAAPAAAVPAPAPIPLATPVVPAPVAVPTAVPAAAPALLPVKTAPAKIHDSLKYRVLSDAFARGSDLETQGKFVAALESYRQGVQADAGDDSCWRGMAGLYDRFHKTDYARQCYQEALRLNPQDGSSRDWLANHPAAP